MNPIELGKFIANLRNEKNLTQEELAEKLYIDKRKISRWECGTSTPEFDMLIKLSEILDVSLYELSICKRIENESITRKVINRFKSIKDFKKYQTKKKLKVILLIIFFIIFIITATYTIKYNNTVEIYELRSLEDKYYLEGNYIKNNNLNLFYIKRLVINNNKNTQKTINFNNCEYGVYNNTDRLFHVANSNDTGLYKHDSAYKIQKNIKLNDIISIKIKCANNNKKIDNYSIDTELLKKYDNKLF